ncbi:MAG: GAF domain-containing protein [Anaerolineae bacterium]|nr:GAF domain-containing protein [Anaerolineae bacterium]
MTSECVRADNGSVIILDERGAVVHKILTRRNMDPEKAKFVLNEVLSQGLAGWVVDHRRSLVVQNVMTDKRWVTFPDDEFVGGSAVSIPLINRERLVGVLTLRHHKTGHFTGELLTLLSVIADQSATAIENARLFHAVQTEQAKLKAVISGAGDAILVTDQNGQIVLMNPVARRAFGIPYDLVLQDQHILNRIDNPSLATLWHKRLSTEPPSSEEVLLQDGRTLSGRITNVPDVGFVITMQDITYLKELDELKTEFVSAVSHDLRSPLQLIYTYTNLLSDAGPVNEKQIEFMDGINRSARKMSDLLDDLLDLARVNAGVGMEKEECDLEMAILKVIARFWEMARKKGLSLESQVPPSLPIVKANVRRIDQVLSNLVDNAIKYTFSGTIRLETSFDEQNMTVRVIDTGIGLQTKEQENLFAKFYRAQNEHTKGIEGTGLGLVIAKSIIEQHGGKMWVQSTWQKGSTFGFSLPIKE